MGEKDTGKLYIGATGGGEMIMLGDTIETVVYEPECDNPPVISVLKLQEPATLEIKTYIGPAAKVFLLTGKWPSNNWFKMHGGVLQRKAYKRKGRYKHG